MRKSEFKLRNTYLSFSKHFPREIQDGRKQLPSMLKQAKTNNRKTVFGKHKLFKQRHYQTVRDSSRGDETWRIFKIIGWNINEGLRTKGGQFKGFLCTYDIICLLEYWIRKDFSLDVEGYFVLVNAMFVQIYMFTTSEFNILKKT